MSTINFHVIEGTNPAPKRRASTTLDADFLSIAVGADALRIQQVGSGASAAFNFGSKALKSTYTPAADEDLVNKAYFDAVVQGLLVKDAVRLATTANLVVTPAGSGIGKTLTADANGSLVIDGVSAVVNDRILVKNQTLAQDNGIYRVSDTGSGVSPYVLTRATDFDGSPSAEVRGGVFTFVQEGTVNSDSGYVVTTNGAIVLDTTAIDWTQFSGAGQLLMGDAIEKVGNTLSVKYDDVTLELNGSNQLRIKDLGVSTAKLANQAVDEFKIHASVAGNGLTGANGSPLAVGAGTAIKVAADNVSVDYAVAKTNDNASPIVSGKVVFVKDNGNVDIATKVNSIMDTELGIVEDASIAAGASGQIIFRRGAIISGFTGLVPGKEYYIDASGDIALYSAITYSVGEHVHMVGKALSATQLIFNPIYKFEY